MSDDMNTKEDYKRQLYRNPSWASSLRSIAGVWRRCVGHKTGQTSTGFARRAPPPLAAAHKVRSHAGSEMSTRRRSDKRIQKKSKDDNGEQS
jgi:hypothetical protein